MTNIFGLIGKIGPIFLEIFILFFTPLHIGTEIRDAGIIKFS